MHHGISGRTEVAHLQYSFYTCHRVSSRPQARSRRPIRVLGWNFAIGTLRHRAMPTLNLTAAASNSFGLPRPRSEDPLFHPARQDFACRWARPPMHGLARSLAPL